MHFILFVRFFHSRPQPVFSKFDHFPEISLFFFRCHFSSLLSSHPHSTFFFPLVSPSVTSVSQSQSCSSPAFPEEAVYKDYRVFFFLFLHQHFCCSQAVSYRFVMFRGKVALKCCRASSKKGRQVCVHMGDGMGGLNSPLCVF